MEDWKKKYEDSLKDMRVVYPNLKGDAKLAVEHAFPELRESEDERIRKFLVDILSHGTWRKEWPFGPNEVVAYLEKQKEQRPADIAPNQFDGITYGMSGCSTEHSKEWGEDEKIMSDIIFAINEVWMKDDADRMIAYLERHKEPFIIHDTGCSKMGAKMPEYCLDVKPAEWSEEDEKMLCNVYESLYAYQCDIRAGRMDKNARELLDDVDAEKAWLKSLPARFHFAHWKPSDEQMEALRIAYEIGTANESWAMSVLKSLYEQLKSL